MEDQLTMYEVISPTPQARKTQKERILDMLRTAGRYGVTSAMLNRVCYRYSARIHELRQDGYDIQGTQVSKGFWKFVLR